MNVDQRKDYRAQIRTSHNIYVRVSMHDHNEDFSHWIRHPILGGQVDVDVHKVPERTLTLDLLDPNAKLSYGRTFEDNFICVEYGVQVDALDRRIWHPVFFGPITGLDPSGDTVTIEAESKETLLQPPVVWGRFIRSTGLGGNTIATWILRDAKASQNEIQAIRAIGPIRGGTWRVIIGAHRSAEVDWDVGAAALETAIEGITGIGSGQVSVTGGPLASQPFHVEFTGTLANDSPGELSIQDNTLTFDDDIRYAARFLRRLLRECGEHRFAFGNLGGARLPKNFKLPKEPESIWSVCRKVIAAVNRESEIHWRIYYDGAGVLRVENMAHGFLFDEGIVLNEPSRPLHSGTRNTVVVAVNRGNEARPVAPEVVSLPRRNAMSPYALRRNGKKRYIVERVDNPHIRTPAQARKLGRARLRKAAQETVTVSFDSMPIPILVPGSHCTLEIDGERRKFHLDQFTLGLTAHDSMAVGYRRRVRTRTRRALHRF